MLFDFVHEFDLPLSEEVVELCSEGAVSIHVLGQRTEFLPCKDLSREQLKARSVEDGWDLISKRIQLNVGVSEINEEGEYTPVEVTKEEGGVGYFQLRQGQLKRLVFSVKPVENSGLLPLELSSIIDASIGSPCVRSKLDKPLDSYQEEDLNMLREAWTKALSKRKGHLQSQIQKFMDLEDKSAEDEEREESLLQQLVLMMEEQNSTYSPPDNSKIPGSYSSCFSGIEGVEKHQPVLFLDTAGTSGPMEEELEVPLFGRDSILKHELGELFIPLPIVGYSEVETSCVASWDSSLHDSPALNKVTDLTERVFMIARVTVRVTQPSVMDIVLRKRLCFTVYKKQSLTERLWRRLGTVSPTTTQGVVYHIVYNLPSTSSDLENRDTLAVAAASGQDLFTGDGESLVEKYSKGVQAVDELLRADRVRQQISLKELLSPESCQTGVIKTMRKTLSVPNMVQMRPYLSSTNISPRRYLHPSDSLQELNKEAGKLNQGSTLMKRLTTSKTMSSFREEHKSTKPSEIR